MSKPNVDEDGFWIGRLDEAPIGAQVVLVVDDGDAVFEVVRRDEEGFLHVIELD